MDMQVAPYTAAARPAGRAAESDRLRHPPAYGVSSVWKGLPEPHLDQLLHEGRRERLVDSEAEGS
jgi:hypothetical protein